MFYRYCYANENPQNVHIFSLGVTILYMLAFSFGGYMQLHVRGVGLSSS